MQKHTTITHSLGIGTVGNTTCIQAPTLQLLINGGATVLAQCPTVAGYIHNAGHTVYTLTPQNNAYHLGIAPCVYTQGMGASAAPALVAFISGNGNGNIVAPNGVRTAVNNAKLAGMHKKWFKPTVNAIKQVVQGNYKFTNNAVYPFVKHTRANNLHKPCLVYVQYQYIHNALHVILHCRAQHLFMLGYNMQLVALQNLQICHLLNLRVGNATIICNNHHVLTKALTKTKNQNPMACHSNSNVIPQMWHVPPCSTAALVKSINTYYATHA
jgi:hypothetical protein